MEKYELLPMQLKREGSMEEENFFHPEKINLEDVFAVHEKSYWEKLSNLELSRQEQLRSGFPLSRELVERELVITGGSLQASLFAIENGIAFNIAGGTHHAYADRAEGFCLLNDIAVSASYLLRKNLAKQILVVDLDVHQGNGTAKIFEDEKRVFTFSMHGEKNYPLKKEKSDLDVPLPDGIEGAEYLKLLNQSLNSIFNQITPDFIFYQSGVDILAGDKLGRLSVSLEDIKNRDRKVLSLAKERGIPIMASMGGGYSKDINLIVEAHANNYRLAREIFD